MKRIVRAVFSSVLSAALLFGAAGAQASLRAQLPLRAQAPATITIFHTNDMHGHMIDTTNSSGMLTTIGSDYVAAIKKSVPGSLLIDAGDSTQGISFANINKGADVIKLMDAAGYDVSTLGNHEFDYGINTLLTNVKNSTFATVSANTEYNGKPLLQGINGGNGCDVIKTVNGVKVGFFGITTQETSYKSNPALLKGVTFGDPIKTSQTEINKLKAEGARVIVGIMHIGNDPFSNPTSEDIAKGVTGLNVIIDGHSHTIENKTVNGTLIVQTQTACAYVGRLDITVNGGAVSSTENLISAAQAQKNYKPDTEVKTLADSIAASQETELNRVVGTSASSFWGGYVNDVPIARLGETKLGDLIADAMANSVKGHVAGTAYANLPVVALENGGGIRASIPEGDITMGQVNSVLPFGNILSMKEVTPAILYQLLDNGVSKVAGQDAATGAVTGADGRFPQISGMRFEYNPAAKTQKVTKVVLLNSDGTDRQTLDRGDTKTKLILVTNDFEDAGGDGYTILAGLKNIGEGDALDVITEAYIRSLTKKGGGTFSYPQTQGRIKSTVIPSDKTFTGTVTLTDASGAAENKQVIYTVDNASAAKATTDANGILTINNLRSGPHTVNIFYGGEFAAAYLNNLAGTTRAAADMSTQSSNEKAGSDVISKILALPVSVSASDKASVCSAKADYAALTATGKALVGNASILAKYAAALTPPHFGSASYSAKSITKKNVTVKIKVSGATVPSVSYIFTKNGSHTFTVKSSAGVSAAKTVTVANIDKTSPAITASVKNGRPTASKVRVKVTDAHLKSKTVKLGGKTIAWQSGIFNKKGGYCIIAIDLAGNRSSYQFVIK